MIAIRAEDKNEWERRAPLTPDHVAHVVERHGIRVRVQPSGLRAFSDRAYAMAGAEVEDDLSDSDVVLGVKEVPLDKLLPGKTYVFFSHVIKGQPSGMPLLRRIMDLGCTLVDYECIADDDGRRLIFFGRHAGYAGMIDSLWALGRRLLHEGVSTPFQHIRAAHAYSGLDAAAAHIARVGERIRHEGLPPDLDPMVFGFTGTGNVSQGAQEILSRLPFADVRPEDLEHLPSDPDRPRNVVFRTVFERHHRFRHAAGHAFDPQELAACPERFMNGITADLAFLTGLIHGAYWWPGQPRLVTLERLHKIWDHADQPKLRVIADVTCDIGGAVEATVAATDPGDPLYVFDLDSGKPRFGIEGRGPVILAVDNLPCELPVESSHHFGDSLIRFLPSMERCPWDRDLDELGLPDEIRRAIVVHRGRLTPAYEYLAPHDAAD